MGTVKVPQEYTLAIVLIEEFFPDYFRSFVSFESFTENAVNSAMMGFAAGRFGEEWRRVSYHHVRLILNDILYNMIERGKVVPESPHYGWMKHLRDMFDPHLD